MQKTKNITESTLIVGEILFDRFPSGAEVLGGAPLNVAWNLHQLAVPTALLSAVGDDEKGSQVLQYLETAGLSTNLVYKVEDFPTGSVDVIHCKGEVSYDINDQQAYDLIPFTKAIQQLEPNSASLIYHGTLALRHAPNQDGLQRLIGHFQAPRFVDVNIREPWFDKQRTVELIETARWIKLNHEELQILSGFASVDTQEQMISAANDLRKKIQPKSHMPQSMVITAGSRVSLWIDYDVNDPQPTVFASSPESIETIVDTVGAGDAFCSACLFGILNDKPAAETLRNANRFAAYACSLEGATSNDTAHYRSFRWSGDQTS